VNFLYLSPEFPPNFQQFIIHLANLGVKVYGIGEADFFDLPERVREKLAWYVRSKLDHPAWVIDALNYMISQNPSLQQEGFQYIEGHNEAWLRLEAILNEHFKIPGRITLADIDRWKKKSSMKQVFQELGLKAARGGVPQDLDDALRLAGELRYPVIVKPDEGVGANGATRINGPTELEAFWPKCHGPQIMEQFIEADMVTYDGLVDRQGNVIFENSLVYSEGVMEAVAGHDLYFYVNAQIDPQLAANGRKMVAGFNLRERFFHFEFFKKGHEFWPLEINCRPPGGPILDMMNYSVDDDLYFRYAQMIKQGQTTIPVKKRHYCLYIGRRDRNYQLNHHEVCAKFKANLVEAFENLPLYWPGMGRYRYILRYDDLASLRKAIQEILAVRS
jgi:hypothetical protein